MAGDSVCAPYDGVTITIPAVLRERIRAEAITDLAAAASNLEEACVWHREHVDRDRLDAEDRPRLRSAEGIYQQALDGGDGELRLTGDARRLSMLLRSCSSAAADDLRLELDSSRPSIRGVRLLLAELSALADVIERHAFATGGAR
jgi:hypothetical protein